MKFALWLSTLFLLLLGCAHTPASTTHAPNAFSLSEQGPVQVRWRDPAEFTESRHVSSLAREQSQWVQDLADYARRTAQARLGKGERLEIEFIDIDRAGDYEPWRSLEYQHTRIVRELYPPRIRLHFVHSGPGGAIQRRGERMLTDAAFLQRASVNNTDPLRHEKNLLRDWIRREFAASVH